MKRWRLPEGTIMHGDCVRHMCMMEPDSVDLVFGSPPYEEARLYLEDGKDLNIARKTKDWVNWMVQVYEESLTVCKGLVAFVVGHGKGAKHWSAGPALLCAALVEKGINLRSPVWFHRVGIMGSGGPDWLRADMEWIICATATAERLPWSDNTACGHPPKYKPGGRISHRNKQGIRVSEERQWGVVLRRVMDKEGLSYAQAVKKLKLENATGWVRGRNGEKVPKNYKPPERVNPGNVLKCDWRSAVQILMEDEGLSQREACRRLGIPMHENDSGYENGDLKRQATYMGVEVANPGNVIHTAVGGHRMGSNIVHENEAGFPEALPDFFIRSFCPPGGVVYDPFSGSGTTAAAAIKTGRRFMASELRLSQVKLTLRRVKQARLSKGMGL